MRTMIMKSMGMLMLVCASAAAARAHAAEVNVSIKNYAFAPKEIMVHAGDIVVWTNRDNVAHSVATLDKTFASPVLNPGQSYRFTFRKTGNYAYRCGVHPFMLGAVKVSPAD